MKTVLDVGQCPPDHAAIARMLESLGANVDQIDLPAAAMELIKKKTFDLVLVNRKIDEDYSDGIELIQMMQADAATRSIPVMLISNYPDAQAEAVRLGALPGFGKKDLDSPAARDRVLKALHGYQKVPL